MSAPPRESLPAAHWPPHSTEQRPLAADVVTFARDALCRQPGDSPVLIFEDDVVVTAHQFRQRLEGLAGYLAERIEPGDRVLIMLDNRAEFMIAWLAVNACGASLVSMNTSAGDHDAGHIVRDSEAVLAIVGAGSEQLIAGVDGSRVREILTVEGLEPDGLERYSAQASPMSLDDVTVDSAATTNVYYTSGTTGPPKGCMVGHDYWIRFVDLYARLYGLSSKDRILCCLQFFYNDPSWQFLVSLDAGTPLVVMRRFSVSRFWGLVTKHRITRLFALASIPALLLKAKASPDETRHEVDFALHIGIPASLHAEFTERWGFPWVEGYGLTETGLVVAMPLEYADQMIGSGSIGIPCSEVRIRLVDDEGAEVAEDEPGEILIKAPGMMHGYLNRPEETARTLDGEWLHSGDVARRDGSGFLYFVGRKKDIIRRAGENVAAAEVENVLRAHPAILDAAVVPVPDELRGEEVKAYVALVEDAVDPPDPAALVAFCGERLARYKVPRYLEFRTEPFPRTPSMRVKKSDLQGVVDPTADAWDRELQLPDWDGRGVTEHKRV